MGLARPRQGARRRRCRCTSLTTSNDVCARDPHAPSGFRRRAGICVVAGPRRCTPTSPAARRLASARAALGTRLLPILGQAPMDEWADGEAEALQDTADCLSARLLRQRSGGACRTPAPPGPLLPWRLAPRGQEDHLPSTTVTLLAISGFGEICAFLPLAVVSPRTVTFSHRLYAKGRPAAGVATPPSGSVKRYMP